jgi:8-oxo-dGTP diphosphatase
MKNIRLAGCIIQDEEGKILLLHRNTPKRSQWEIPGGKIDETEDVAAAAAREVREELGIEVKVLRELDTKSFTEDGYTMEYTWFSAQVVGTGQPKVMEPDTHDKYQFFSQRELEELMAELSPNAANFLKELQAKRIVL